MILIQSDIKDDGFDVLCRIKSSDAGGELAAILKAIEGEHPNILAQALDFYLARKHGTPYCTVRIQESGLIEKVPTSCIEIRR